VRTVAAVIVGYLIFAKGVSGKCIVRSTQIKTQSA
jgi:hypothetical protein